MHSLNQCKDDVLHRQVKQMLFDTIQKQAGNDNRTGEFVNLDITLPNKLGIYALKEVATRSEGNTFHCIYSKRRFQRMPGVRRNETGVLMACSV